MKIFKEPDFNKVTNEWLLEQLHNKKLSRIDFARLINVDVVQVHNWLSGNRKPSNPTRALFYYFFKFYNSKKK